MAGIVKLDPGYYPDPNIGRPVSNADIFVGEIDTDPEVPINQKQISVRQENGDIVQVTQPMHTGAGGVPEYLGSPVTILVDGAYSLKVLDSSGAQVYYIPESEISIASLMGVDHNSDGSHIVFESVADFRASALTFFDGQKMSFTGYYTAGDGGGQDIFWNATSTLTDNGFTIFKRTDTTTGRGLSVDKSILNERHAGAKGDGVTDDTPAFSTLNTYLNTDGGTINMTLGQYLIDAGTLDLVHHGITINGAGVGNITNVFPSTEAPTNIIISGEGAGIRVRGNTVTLSNFRLSADTARAAELFDIDSPGIRVEPDDESDARADGCYIYNVRIDSQPGDGVLQVGLAIYANYEYVNIYDCAGFGFRMDAGNHPDLIRTHPSYPGLSRLISPRVGFCGGHSIGISNDTSVLQSEMGIRIYIEQLDSFGNGQNTDIMYESADTLFYDVWVFGENCEIKQSGISGSVGFALTPELRGGIWIAGRDNKITNCRFIETKQPIYWGHNASQPSTGLEVDMFRLVNTTLTHTFAIRQESGDSKGLRVSYDRTEHMLQVSNPAFSNGAIIEYQGTHRHLNSIFTTEDNITIEDDSVYELGLADGAYGVLTIATSSVAAGGGIFHLRVSSPTPIATKWAGESNTIAYAGGGALTGTTGTDTTLNVSCDDTSIYIENRRGFTVALNIHFSATPLKTSAVIP